MTELTRANTGKKGRRGRRGSGRVFDPRPTKFVNDQDMSKHTIRAIREFQMRARTPFPSPRLPVLTSSEHHALANLGHTNAFARNTNADWRLQ